MIILVKPAPYGGNAIRYAMEKEKAEIILKNHLPDGITPTAIWNRMKLHCLQHECQHTHGRPMQNFMVTFVISPSPEECKDWTKADFSKLTKEVLHEIDTVDISRMPKCQKCKSTNFQNSMSVSALHHDSKSGVLHMHLDACRLDMDGQINDLHQIHIRCMKAAENINRRHGWKQPAQIREERREQISNACLDILRHMQLFNLQSYFHELNNKGYVVKQKKDRNGKLHGYTVVIGATVIKASELGTGRNLMASKLEATWKKLHKDDSVKQSHPSSAPVAQKPQPVIVKPTSQTVIVSHYVPKPRFSTVSIKAAGEMIECKVPNAVMDIFSSEASLPDDVLWSTVENVANTAILLFCGYVDGATAIAHDSGGGGGVSSGWGRKKDEDDKEWARRCLAQARCMHQRVRGRRR